MVDRQGSSTKVEDPRRSDLMKAPPSSGNTHGRKQLSKARYPSGVLVRGVNQEEVE